MRLRDYHLLFEQDSIDADSAVTKQLISASLSKIISRLCKQKYRSVYSGQFCPSKYFPYIFFIN